MCGIVGHIGPSNSVDMVMEGLRRLEYRGYDSAGICYKEDDEKLHLYKKAGKIDNLKKILDELPTKPVSHRAIGHTRWATHGGVNDVNAHPHMSDTMAVDDENLMAIVHNGIIENAEELKKNLISEGVRFKSETDSEVFLALLALEMRNKKNIVEAIANAFRQVRGNSAFVIQTATSSEIYAIKKGAPLVCGTHEHNHEVLVSSDPYALAGFADRLYFPEDNVICILSANIGSLISFFELDGSSSNRFSKQKQKMNVEVSQKGTFEHYMLKEIYEQPTLIRILSQYYQKGKGNVFLQTAAKISPSKIHISACGTAWHAGLLIRNFVEKYNRIPCSVELASEFRYRNPILAKNELGLFISQSGETADTLAALHLCKEHSLETLSIVNVEGSTLFRECNSNLLTKAGTEIGVASTKAFTQQVLTGWLWAHAISKKISKEQINNYLELLAQRIEELLNRAEDIRKIAEEIYNYKGFVFTGRGLEFPVALEGALKLKEIAYVHAEGYAAGELKHGPIALIDESIVNIALVTNELFEKSVSNVQEVKARRGVMVIIGPENNLELKKLADFYIPLDLEGLDDLVPVYANVANQLLAYFMAKFKGTDIDRPRNLAKSVTVE